MACSKVKIQPCHFSPHIYTKYKKLELFVLTYKEDNFNIIIMEAVAGKTEPPSINDQQHSVCIMFDTFI